MDTSVTALIATRSRELRDALQALLVSTTQIHSVHQTSDVQTTIDILMTHHPAITLCDYVIFNEIGVLANTQLLVLVDNRMEQNEVVNEGIRNVVITGTPVEKLVTMINSLLNPGEGSADDD